MTNGSYVSQLVLWYKEQPFRDFPGGAVFATSLSNAGGVGSIPGWINILLLAIPPYLSHPTIPSVE